MTSRIRTKPVTVLPVPVQTRVVLVDGDVIFPPRLVPKYDRFDGVSLTLIKRLQKSVRSVYSGAVPST
jgi:hypothetical protein